MPSALPRISISDLAETTLDPDEIREAVAGNKRVSGRAVTEQGGGLGLRLAMKASDSGFACAGFAKEFLSSTWHEWPETHVYLIGQPVYLLPGSGVVITQAGEIVEETIYPSSGEQTEERILGADLTTDTFADYLKNCETLDERWWAPLLSRWSNVYFHAVTESLAQKSLHRRLGMAGSLSYVAPVDLLGCQELAVSRTPNLNRSGAPLVKVPRLLLTDELYKHAVMGPTFYKFAEETRRSAPPPRSAPRRVYISRLHSPIRRMRNESILIETLRKFDFAIVEAERLSFDQQVRLFSAAEMIVGPHGAGLVNAAFAPTDCTLLELRSLNRMGESPYWGASYRKLAAIKQMPYYAHVSRNEHDEEDWDAAIDEIERLVCALLLP